MIPAIAVNQQIFCPAGPLHFADGADLFSVNCLDGAANKFPIKELTFFELDYVRFVNAYLTVSKRFGSLDRIMPLKLQNKSVVLKPEVFNFQTQQFAIR